MVSLKEALCTGSLELKDFSPSPFLDSKILLEYALSFEDVVLKDPNFQIPEDIFSIFKKYIDRRKEGEPISYITGYKEFFGLKFKVKSGVLIPRPDTEILVEEAINIIDSNSKINHLIDLCTGSGAISVSILHKKKHLSGIGIDVSDEALDIARQNASVLIPNENLAFKKLDILTEDLEIQNGSIVLSNPPYIRTSDISTLDKTVKNFEPKLALDGGEDGLIFYRQIARKCKNAEFVLLEIGQFMRDEVSKIFINEGYTQLFCKNDLTGIERVLAFTYKKNS